MNAVLSVESAVVLLQNKSSLVPASCGFSVEFRIIALLVFDIGRRFVSELVMLLWSTYCDFQGVMYVIV